MSKALKRLMPAALAASLCAWAATQATHAQTQTGGADAWVAVSPAGEGFGVMMSKKPASSEQRVKTDGLSASGRRYTAAADGGLNFTVWSLKDPDETGRRLFAADNSAEGVGGEILYLDRVAQLSWELLVAPELERIGREGDMRQRVAAADIGMTFERQFKVSDRPAREYSVRLEHERGLVYVCADGARVYILAGLGIDEDDPRLRQFADSFTIGGTPRLPQPVPTLPAPVTIQIDPALVKVDPNVVTGSVAPSSGTGTGGGTGTGMGTGTGPGYNSGGGDLKVGGGGPGPGDGPVDYTRPFRQNQVTKKALILSKPQPGFTEWARRFNVTGVVRLRAILHYTGAVQGVAVVKSLPHGLTRKSIDAARQIRFEPAQKDGRAVSQYVVLEYNYNIY